MIYRRRFEIFEFLYPEINVIHSKDVEIENFDYQIPICSLPYILRINGIDDLSLKKYPYPYSSYI